MSARQLFSGESAAPAPASFTPVRSGLLQRKCACGGTPGATGECGECAQKLQRQTRGSRGEARNDSSVPPIVHEVLRSPGQSLDSATRAFFEPRFGHDFSSVSVHADARAGASARAVGALAYTVGRDIIFSEGTYAPTTVEGRSLLAHELAHTLQQSGSGSPLQSRAMELSAADSAGEREADATSEAVLADRLPPPVQRFPVAVQRRASPYIKKVTVHLTPLQSADLEWEGVPPETAGGKDHFTVSTGKGYGDPGDPPGTCTRTCCTDPDTQCAPPYNEPGRVGACCTYHGSSFWTGTPEAEHNGWKYWTPIQPYYSRRAIALHQHTEVTGQPIGHGCVRMAEENAKRIADYSNGRQTNVTLDGRAAPVACEENRRCGTGGGGAAVEAGADGPRLATVDAAVPGLEGEMT